MTAGNVWADNPRARSGGSGRRINGGMTGAAHIKGLSVGQQIGAPEFAENTKHRCGDRAVRDPLVRRGDVAFRIGGGINVKREDASVAQLDPAGLILITEGRRAK